jgi:predicted nucleic acid-binding protein
VSRIVLDAGALIALERNDRALWAALKLAALQSSDVLVPSAALAQVWRGSATQARLATALDHCVIAAFDAIAREVGELCGRAGTADICDAQVAIVAATKGDVLYTSDPADMRRLLAACRAVRRGRTPVIVRC